MMLVDTGQNDAPDPSAPYTAGPYVVTPRSGRPTRITEPSKGDASKAPAGTADPFDALPAWRPPGETRGTTPGAAVQAGGEHPFDALPEWKPSPAKPPSREVDTGEALGTGMLSGVTFGGGPALAGLSEAGGTARSGEEIRADPQGMTLSDAASPFIGAYKMLRDWIGGTNDPEVHAAYERGRQAALENQQLAQEQHPHAFFAGQIAGALATPTFGAGIPGSLGMRFVRGTGAGAIGGGLYGAGTAFSEGAPAEEVVRRAAITGAISAPLGGVLGATLGRRAINPNTPGQRAAATAEALGAPIPRGLASDNPVINASAAAVRSMPIFGARMGAAAGRTQEAAGQAVEGISGSMAGPATNRATADMLVRPGLQAAIDANRQTIDAGYNALRQQINTTQRYTMPRTNVVLNDIEAARRAAGWTNPEQGLEQFRNVAAGTTFNGAHRARVDAREAGNVVVPHPGYNAGDFNRLTRAMTADLRNMVQIAAGPGQGAAGRALDAFDAAERTFGELSQRNDLLNRLVNSRGEGAIATLLGAAKEKGGNLQLLAQLRRSMPPQDFSIVGGLLLNELGQRQGNFSLGQFTTRWNTQVSDGAKRVLFSPAHRDHIDEIVNLGQQIRGALRDTNTSHTSNTIILFDLTRDAIMLGIGLGTGHLAAGTMAGGALAASPAVVFAHWLSTPATASSMSAWSRAWFALAQAPREPARIATFNMATRNLSNQIGVPIERILQSAKLHAEDRTDEQR